MLFPHKECTFKQVIHHMVQKSEGTKGFMVKGKHSSLPCPHLSNSSSGGNDLLSFRFVCTLHTPMCLFQCLLLLANISTTVTIPITTSCPITWLASSWPQESMVRQMEAEIQGQEQKAESLITLYQGSLFDCRGWPLSISCPLPFYPFKWLRS